ncbi:MAG TPA: hypothetical protein VJV79_38995 [Polyangiaceae bacterium]|nr:hypothetical protein [Polyangiaceae bacterium]
MTVFVRRKRSDLADVATRDRPQKKAIVSALGAVTGRPKPARALFGVRGLLLGVT